MTGPRRFVRRGKQTSQTIPKELVSLSSGRTEQWRHRAPDTRLVRPYLCESLHINC